MMRYRVEIVVDQEDGDDEAHVNVTIHDVGDSIEDRQKIGDAVQAAVYLIKTGIPMPLSSRH